MEELGPDVQPAALATKRASIGSPSSTPSSRGKSGPSDFSSRESDIPRVPRHQKLKHLVTELGSLVDCLTQDSASLESEKAEKELWKKMYRELKRKKGEDKILEVERDLHAKKLKIKMLKEKLEEKSEEVNELADLNKLLITKRLRNEEREQARQDFNMREREKALKKIIELERNLDGKQKLEMEIEEFKRKLEVMKRIRDDEVAAVQQKIHLLDEQLQQNMKEMDGLKHLNQQLIVKDKQSSHELQEAHNGMIGGLSGMLSSTPVNIGVKRMGEIDEKAFKNAWKSRFSSDEAELRFSSDEAESRFSSDEAELRFSSDEAELGFSSDEDAVELCSLWQERIENPEWKPFRIGEDDKGNPKELLEEDDEVLKGLKDQWGDEIYNAVTSALIDLREYNPCGRYVVSELWNFDKNRKATLKEGIHNIFTQLQSQKGKRKLK